MTLQTAMTRTKTCPMERLRGALSSGGTLQSGKHSKAKREQQHVRVVLAGDILLHTELQREAFAYHPPSYRHLFGSSVQKVLRDADIAFANFEGASAPGVGLDGRVFSEQHPLSGPVFGPVYTSWRPGHTANAFNYHPQLARDLAHFGVDVVSTANNHAADRGAIGIERTLAVLRNAGLATTGTRATNLSHSKRSHDWVAVVRRHGIGVGFLACTDWVNSEPHESRRAQNDSDHSHAPAGVSNATLWCYSNSSSSHADLMPSLVRHAARRRDVDALIVIAHIRSREYDPTPAERTRCRSRHEPRASRYRRATDGPAML